MSNEFLLFAFSVSEITLWRMPTGPRLPQSHSRGRRECKEKKHGQEVLK